MLGRLSNTNQFLEKKIIDTYIKKFSKKSIIASCEDYRAGASIDLIHHNRDRKKIATKREREYISATKLSMFLKASIIKIEIIIAAIT